jgi:RNA polymerase sigma factor (sigma-70 family)
VIAQEIVGQAPRLPGLRDAYTNKGGAGDAPALEFNGPDNALRRAFARVSVWRTPPHWSRRDWLDEAQAIIHSAAACAVFDYDVERGVPLRAHIYVRAVAAAWTRYRQEWSYHLHSADQSGKDVESIAMPFDRAHAYETIEYFLGHALNRLPVEDQLLIEQLFWNGRRQKRVAVTLDVSQQEVSRRKARALRQLRRLLNSHASLLLSRLVPVWWALLDSLDLLPAIDLL